MDAGIVSLVVLPLGLGLLGFIEPCSIGASLLFVKYLEGKSEAMKIVETTVFILTRALFIGALGAIAGLIGAAFIDAQKGFWILLGMLYLGLGAALMFGRLSSLMRSLGPSLSRLRGAHGSASLGVLFGLNIPACAAPLLFALFAMAALGGKGEAALRGFVMLGLFGFALSLPLGLAVLWPGGRTLLDRLAGLSQRTPLLTGVVLAALGLWSIYFGLSVDLEDWT
jgi:cytochrome c-type biogenesis protein